MLGVIGTFSNRTNTFTTRVNGTLGSKYYYTETTCLQHWLRAGEYEDEGENFIVEGCVHLVVKSVRQAWHHALAWFNAKLRRWCVVYYGNGTVMDIILMRDK